MSIVLTHGKFGESAIRLVRLVRKGDRQEVRDLSVQLLLRGDFERAFTEGAALPLGGEQAIADRVYALAQEHSDQIEPFALVLSQHVLRFFPQVNEVDVDISERIWSRVVVSGRPHDQAFTATGEQRLTHVTRNAEGAWVEAGFTGLPILRILPSSASAHGGIFSGMLTARWRYGWTDVPFALHWQQVRQVVLESFANHAEGSMHHVLHDMAQAALDQTPSIAEMRFVLNVTRHHPADLSRSGMQNDGDLLIPETGAVGVIEATVLRET